METHERTTPPRTSSPLNPTWLRITGKDEWRQNHGTVYSVDWTDLRQQVVSSVGYYHVVYTYEVEGERYIGRFTDFASVDEDYLRAGDEIAIRYNPRNPSKSYYPEVRTQSNFRLVCFIVGAAIACIVMLLALLTGVWK